MLKRPRNAADELRMFLRRKEPILLADGGIDGLCASLNRPVVDIEDLPAGPASAVIGLHRSASGGRCLAVAVRSEDSGAVALFAFRGELNTEVVQAMDAGLQFAEGMGFLFDEDMLADGAPGSEQKALEIWCELTRDEVPGRRPAAAEPPAAAPEDVLILDDLIDPLETDEAEAPREQGAPSQRRVLSKFRHPADAPPPSAEPDAEASPAELGRIPIVRRRREGADPNRPASAPLLARLLARF